MCVLENAGERYGLFIVDRVQCSCVVVLAGLVAVVVAVVVVVVVMVPEPLSLKSIRRNGLSIYFPRMSDDDDNDDVNARAR